MGYIIPTVSTEMVAYKRKCISFNASRANLYKNMNSPYERESTCNNEDRNRKGRCNNKN